MLQSCHAVTYNGHFGGHRIAAKVLQVIIGLLFLKILMNLLNVVTGAKEHGTFLKSMKCH